MSGRFEPADEWDPRLALTAPELLSRANAAGVLTAAACHVARRLAELAGVEDDRVLLASALAVRAVTHGSVGVDLRTVAESLDPDRELGWPAAADWVVAVRESALVTAGVLRYEHDLLYLDRYHRLEVQVCADLLARLAAAPPVVDQARLTAALDRIFPVHERPEQRAAAQTAARSWTTVVTGGPGTGKTTTVAGLIASLRDQGERLSVAITAPTGKAAARLQESIGEELGRLSGDDAAAVGGLQSLTLHRLLGWQPGNATRFRHHRGNRLGHDLIVVDESSMVDLMMMARLLEAVRPDARLVLVGDPDQLTSVGAGAVLADLVRGFAERAGSAERDSAERAAGGARGADSPVVALATNHRYGPGIASLAQALRAGDPDTVMACLRRGGDEVEYVELDPADQSAAEAIAAALKPQLVATALEIREQAESGDVEAALAAVDRHRLICAHREGPYGVAHWNRQVEQWLAQAVGTDHWPQWYAGRPLLVTTNDYGLGVYNGETGCVVRAGDGTLRGVINGTGGALDFAVSRLADVDTMHALTVHKSQGSQVDRVTVLLPPEDSRLLTRELFYTAVTRARSHVRVIGSEAEVVEAVRRRAERATGLRQRLAEG